MKKFLDKDFLLDTSTAVKLYQDHAEKLPIVDYHSSLIAKEIAENRKFSNITELWLYSDHNRHRAMRSCRVDEKYITGEASDFEKFREYCRIMPLLIGNPLYHWSHLELRKYFGCELIINAQNCEEIWRMTSEKLARNSWGAKDYILYSNVRLICTLDDPSDDLHYHEQIKKSETDVQVLPAFCPNRGLSIDKKGISEYIHSLAESTGTEIIDYYTLCKAYEASLDRFDEMGCRTAVHCMEEHVRFCKPDPYHANEILKKAIVSDGAKISENELALFNAQMMRFFGLQYVRRGWVLQLHGSAYIPDMISMLDYLEESNALPKTIVYPAIPMSNAEAALCSAYYRDGRSNVHTPMQGNKWWFNDSIDDMIMRMKSLAAFTPLGDLLGVVTDSYNVISYPRHDCFRRILCNIVGEWVENGMYPDFEAAEIVERISLYNAVDYFEFKINK